MVSMVPMVLHEIDFTILRYDFSLMLMLFVVKKKAQLISRRAYKYLGFNLPINWPPSEKLNYNTYTYPLFRTCLVKNSFLLFQKNIDSWDKDFMICNYLIVQM